MSKILKKVTSGLLAAALALSLIPALAPAVYAEENSTGSTVLDKTAELQPDGTYTINLEAYTTGEETVQTTKAPLDIVLVLDVSGSMSNSFGDEIYTARDSQKYSYNDLNNKEYYYKDGSTYYRVYRTNNGGSYRLYYLKNGSTIYLYGTTTTTERHTDVTKQGSTIWTGVLYEKSQPNRLDALKSAVGTFIDGVVADSTAEAQHRISLIKYAGWNDGNAGATGASTTYGTSNYNHTQITNDWTVANSDGEAALKTRVNSFTASGATAADLAMSLATTQIGSARSDAQKVVVFFTDGEPNHNNGFDSTVANSAINSAKTMKNGGTVIYTIGILNETNTGTSTNVGKYMNGLSSNYPAATSINNLGNKAPNANYYKLASDASQLSAIFSAIATSIQTPTINLGSQSVVRDIISDYFALPAGFNPNSNIQVSTMDCTGASGDDLVFTNKQPLTNASVAVDLDTATISVTNFDYKENWCGKRSDGTYSGKKLMIEITGIQATEAALKDGYLKTNADGSGIYADGNASKPAQEFPFPEVILYETVYVLDYAKTTPVPTTLQEPSVLGADFTESTIRNIPGTYGTFSLSADAQLYTPTTTQWTGADYYYAVGKAVGKKEGRVEGERVWEKVTVLPANNVYYEDSFVTNASIGVSGAEVQCAIGIEYSGSWTVVGTDSGNTGSAHIDHSGSASEVNHTDDSAQGWIADLAVETGFTDGAAHQADCSATATATVSFKGTGIEVYTRTDIKSGVVYALLMDNNEGGSQTKLEVIDNKAASGNGYYSVPTLTYMDLPYGLYTLKISVTSTPQSRMEGRCSYCIDGIRVYNPIDPAKEAEVVGTAYGEEAGSKFYTLHDMSGISGSVFVDDMNTAAPVITIINEAGEEEIVENPDYDEALIGNEVTLANVGDFMANNEIYLKGGATISFKVSGGTNYYLGMKSLTGETVTCEVSAGSSYKKEYSFSHTADMYYELETSGTVTIKNTGDGVLSLTKLKVTGGSASSYSLTAITGESGKQLAVAFASYSLVGSGSAPIAEEDLPEEVIAQPEVTEEVEPEAPVVEIEEPVLPRENSTALGTLELPGLDLTGRDNARTLVSSILASFRSILR